jgi:glycosyltransferase involved in cell wall biosynthesis
MRFCDHLFANCAETKVDSLVKVSVPPAKISILPNGIEVPDPETNAKHPEPFWGKLSPGREPIVSCLTHMSLGKGWGHFCQLARALREEGARFQLLVLGNGYLRGSMERDIERYSLADRTIFAGAVRDDSVKARLLRASSLFLYPSSPGTTVLEALAAGTPVVIARRRQDCSAGMDWEPFGRLGVGRVFQDASPYEVASEVRNILEQRNRLRSDLGVEYCRRELSWERIAALAEDAYVKLLNGAATSPEGV